ncbi:MAG: acetylglutamate kinase [Candidatus Methylomirabilis sp.]|nr:acetylglutamate kinase [Deltaproteobacteria bacterium]
MEQSIRRAEVLLEALPYIREFYGKVVVVKYGGHAMVDERLKAAFAQDIVLLKYVGINPVVVHGGGPQIDKVLDQMGVQPSFVRGMRVTDAPTMSVVEMVLVGQVNKQIVGGINLAGGRAVGLSGKDGGLIRARKMVLTERVKYKRTPEIIDIGMVGEVEKVDPAVLNALDRDRFIPVIAPVGIGEQGETYNINADLVAGAVAEALGAEKLVLLTDVEGVKDGDGKLLGRLSIKEAKALIKSGVAGGGMIPKLECCIHAIEGGVRRTHIVDGRVEHSVILELFTRQGSGTMIEADGKEGPA